MADNTIEIEIGKGSVAKGETQIPIQLPEGVGNGEYVLYAKYSGNENYMPSYAKGKLVVGYRSMVHVPRIYIWDKYLTNCNFKANVYVGAHPVTVGSGCFKLDGGYIDNATETPVRSGSATKIWDISTLDYKSTAKHKVAFKYYGSKEKTINPGLSKDGKIYVLNSLDPAYVKLPGDEKNAFAEIKMSPVVGKPGDTVTTEVRILRAGFGEEGYKVVDKGHDIPNADTGTVRLGYEGMRESNWWKGEIDDNGYCQFTFTIPEKEEGAYDLYATWNGSTHWARTYGCTTMFITSYTPALTEPTITIQSVSFNKAEQNAYVQCKFNAPTNNPMVMTGLARLYIDDQPIVVTNSNAKDETWVPVTSTGFTEFQFAIATRSGKNQPVWAYPGKHKLTIVYKPSNNDEEYTYTPSAVFIIRRATKTTIANVDDDYGIIYMPDNGDSTNVRVLVDDADADTDSENDVSEGDVIISYSKKA